MFKKGCLLLIILIIGSTAFMIATKTPEEIRESIEKAEVQSKATQKKWDDDRRIAAEKAAKEAAERPKLGDIARLTMGEEQGMMYLAVDEKALDEYEKAISAGDSHGITQLMLVGKLIGAQSRTRVRVLEGGVFRTKVRILEGDSNGQAGWIPAEFVKIIR